jgi:phosphate:Na+ symporter
MLLSLTLIREASEPLKQSPLLSDLLATLGGDPIFAILTAAIVTYIVHSSLATILLFASLAGSGVIGIELGLLLVLGANIGGAMVPFIATYKDGAIARQITLGNILMRVTMLILFMPALPYVLEQLSALNHNNARQLVHFHTGFNIALALVFMPIVQIVASLCKKIFPYIPNEDQSIKPQYLEEHALDSPAIALSGAARESLRIAELVEDMLEKIMAAFKQKNADLIAEIRDTEDDVDVLYKATKLYLARLSQEGLSESEAQRYMQILSFTTNLEHIGDVIDKSLLELAEKKIKHQYHFSDEGWKEIRSFHAQVLGNMKLAQAVFMSNDQQLAEQLIGSKSQIRQEANMTAEQHFKRLEDGNTKAMETSSLHLDVIRDYRRINSYATRVAYTILENNQNKY